MSRKTGIVLIVLLVGLTAFAGKIKRAYFALEVYNYFEAKRLFEKLEKKHPVPATYGLSVIYQRSDNPFTNIDSAYVKINHSLASYSTVNEKWRLKYSEFGVDSLAIVRQRDFISEIMYSNAVEQNTVEALSRFVEMHPWSNRQEEAIYKRDSIAFDHAITQDKSEGFDKFLKEYPNSVFATEAQSTFDRLLYVENTASDNFVDYLSFLDKYPNSPYRPDAEDKIYQISTRTGTPEAYERFIKDFPTNQNVQKAWKKLFNAHLQTDYSTESLIEFKNRFPDYPYSEELEKQLELAQVKLLPVMSEDKWGFVSLNRAYSIPMEFDEVEQFSEGLAPVRQGDKYGYIDKLGHLVIPSKFDDALSFNEGHAVVEINEKWGMINRNGEFTVEPLYEDLGNLKEGLAYFSVEDVYGYFDNKGIVRVREQFEDAYDFEKKRAIVSVKGYYGVIDPFGTTYIPPIYQDLSRYGAENSYKAKLRSNYGIIRENGDTLVPFIYDYIGDLKDGRAIVERGGEFNYIDREGKVILTNWIENYSEFRQLAEFKEGYAKVKLGDSYNLIDTNGRKLYARDQADIGQYGTLVAALKGRHWGYLNHAGKMVIPNTFTMARSFRADYGVAGSEPLWGVIDKKGQYIIEPYFEAMEFYNDTLMLAKSRGFYGLLSIEGDTLLGFSYTSIEPIDEEIVELQKNGRLFYYYLPKGEFIRPKE